AMLDVDLETPRPIGRLAVQLLVEPVADPADPLGEQDPGRGGIRELAGAAAGALDDDRAGNRPEENSAPDAETALPDLENALPLRIGHLVPARDVVVEACADDPGRNAPDCNAQHDVPVTAPPHVPNPGQADGRRDREQEHQ